jgi:uncharacterized protein YacL
MNVTPFILAVRAISAEFGQRLYLPIVLIASGGLIVGLVVSIVLVATVSSWWWLLLAPLLFVTVVFIVLGAVTFAIFSMLKPVQSKEQRRLVKSFADSLQYAADTVQTPKVVLLFRLAKDIVTPKQSGFIQELSAHSASLRDGFTQIIASFRS